MLVSGRVGVCWKFSEIKKKKTSRWISCHLRDSFHTRRWFDSSQLKVSSSFICDSNRCGWKKWTKHIRTPTGGGEKWRWIYRGIIRKKKTQKQIPSPSSKFWRSHLGESGGAIERLENCASRSIHPPFCRVPPTWRKGGVFRFSPRRRTNGTCM